MPIYEYTCRKCGNRYEYLHRSSDAAADEVTCPDCGSKDAEKVFSTFSVSTLPSFGGGSTCCGSDSPEGGCGSPGSCCSGGGH